MNIQNQILISKEEREQLMCRLVQDLPVLRAKIGISQEDLCTILGISRQTYSAVETRKRMMSWHTYLTLVLYFAYNSQTRQMVHDSGILSGSLSRALNYTKR